MTNLFKIPCLDNHKGKITGEIILKTYNYICTEIFKNEKGSHRRKEIELRFIIEVENGLFFPLFEQGNEYFKDWVVNANNDSLSNDFSEDDYAQSMIDVYINLSEDIYGNDKGEKSSAKDEFSRISSSGLFSKLFEKGSTVFAEIWKTENEEIRNYLNAKSVPKE